MWQYILIGLSFGIYAAMTPGSFQAYLLAQSLKNGWRSALPIAAAPLASDGPILVLILLVLTQTPDWALTVIRLVGGGFILYLAYSAWRTVQSFDWSHPAADAPAGEGFWKGALMNFLNPNPYIFWSLIAGPILLEAWDKSPWWGMAFFVSFYVSIIGGFAALIILFSFARQLGPKITRWLSIFSAGALFLFGIYQIIEGVRQIFGGGA